MNIVRICVALLIGIALMTDHAAYADNRAKIPAPVVAIIDVQKILQESQAAKSVQKQIDAQRSKFQNETEKEENALRQIEQDLSKARGQIAPDLYADREQQLRQRTLTVERHFEARRKVLDQAFADAKNAMSNALIDIVQATAKDHGANMVLVKQQVLWADPAFDITAEVLDRLNKKLPDIQIKMTSEAKE